jgi:hypothetical protein
MGDVAEESPGWTREDRLGPWGTRTVILVPVPAAGPDSREASARRPPPRRIAIGLDRLHWYATCGGHGKNVGPLINFVDPSGIAMHLESTIIERVEACVRHPVFAGSDKAMDLVLYDLESLEQSGQIGRATYRRLRGLMLRSPHIVPCR